jgi:hypothetical protein
MLEDLHDRRSRRLMVGGRLLSQLNTKLDGLACTELWAKVGDGVKG